MFVSESAVVMNAVLFTDVALVERGWNHTVRTLELHVH